MALEDHNVVIGAPVVSVSPWVTNAGAGTFRDLGHLSEAPTVKWDTENYDQESESVLGVIKTKPIKQGGEITIGMLEATADNLALLTRQPSTQLSGTTPNRVLAISDSQAIDLQMKFVGPGPEGTAGVPSVRTELYWKCQVVSSEPIPHAKAGAQVYKVVLRIMRDSSVASPSTNGSFGKQSDTGGS